MLSLCVFILQPFELQHLRIFEQNLKNGSNNEPHSNHSFILDPPSSQKNVLIIAVVCRLIWIFSVPLSDVCTQPLVYVNANSLHAERRSPSIFFHHSKPLFKVSCGYWDAEKSSWQTAQYSGHGGPKPLKGSRDDESTRIQRTQPTEADGVWQESCGSREDGRHWKQLSKEHVPLDPLRVDLVWSLIFHVSDFVPAQVLALPSWTGVDCCLLLLAAGCCLGNPHSSQVSECCGWFPKCFFGKSPSCLWLLGFSITSPPASWSSS